MSQIDWSKAPAWANVFLGPACGSGNFAWAESFIDEARYMLEHGSGHNGRLNLVGYHNWSLVSERPAAQQWNGTGLPPVGTVCEFREYCGTWAECTIIGEFKGRIICGCNATGTVGYIDLEELRPIRTPEQIAAEEREAAIKHACSVVGCAVGSLYGDVVKNVIDAGYRRQSTCDPTGHDD